MKKIALVFLGLFLLLNAQAFAADAQKPSPKASGGPIISTVGEWLAIIDAGRYDESWTKASALFKGAASAEQWVMALNGVRKPLGAMLSRNVSNVSTKTSLPGAPDGNYVILIYKTSFANKKDAIETVTFMKESDGNWRAAGYFIK